MASTLKQVLEFHRAFNLPVERFPSINNKKLNKLRVSLIEEETRELKEALRKRNPVAVLDALTDLQYVLDGAYIALGFMDVKNPAFIEVHGSNMSKLGANGKPIKRKDGKVLKGLNYRPPNLEQFL